MDTITFKEEITVTTLPKVELKIQTIKDIFVKDLGPIVMVSGPMTGKTYLSNRVSK